MVNRNLKRILLPFQIGLLHAAAAAENLKNENSAKGRISLHPVHFGGSSLPPTVAVGRSTGNQQPTARGRSCVRRDGHPFSPGVYS